ncbi:MAG: zinc-binding dehydrogenase [Dehalococcoidales bacterium]|nr:zinc-binding dehydrogenase [Dehalococcoidales bacterium]
MRVAMWYGGEDIRVEDLPEPVLKEHDVKVRVVASAVCGTDVHSIEGKFPLTVPPRVLGHEFSGVVAEVGSAVKKVALGDRVAVEPGAVCNSCWFCRNGMEHLCLAREMSPGAFSEYAVVPERLLWKIPDSLSLEAAALAEPVACAVHAIDLAQLRSGSAVAIIGGGGIGLSLMQLSQHSGAAITIVSEPDAGRRELAKKLGADVVIDPRKEDPVEAVRKATGGLGADVVFEAVGLPATSEQSVQLAAKGAHVVLVGVNPPGAEIRLQPYDLFARELTISAVYMRPYTFGRALRWLAKLDMTAILGPEFRLEKTLDAIHALRDKEGIKPLVRP